MSQKLGFARFELIRGVRKNFEARQYQTGEPMPLEPWSLDKTTNKYEKIRTKVPESNCQHLTQSSYYLNANGQLSTCCYFNTSLCADSVDQLPDIRSELGTNPRSRCLKHCGN